MKNLERILTLFKISKSKNSNYKSLQKDLYAKDLVCMDPNTTKAHPTSLLKTRV